MTRRVKRSRLFTVEQEQFVRDNIKGTSRKDMLKMVNDEFGLNIKLNQLVAFIKNRKLRSGVNAQFKKGHTPVNKGKKFPGQTNSGSFVKGQKAFNQVPVGSEVTKDGYTFVKVSETGHQRTDWQFKHRVLWEKHHGEIPAGKRVMFLDGDRTNITIDNLVIVTQKELSRLNLFNLIDDDPEFTKAGVSTVRLLSEIDKKEEVLKG